MTSSVATTHGDGMWLQVHRIFHKRHGRPLCGEAIWSVEHTPLCGSWVQARVCHEKTLPPVNRCRTSKNRCKNTARCRGEQTAIFVWKLLVSVVVGVECVKGAVTFWATRSLFWTHSLVWLKKKPKADWCQILRSHKIRGFCFFKGHVGIMKKKRFWDF